MTLESDGTRWDGLFWRPESETAQGNDFYGQLRETIAEDPFFFAGPEGLARRCAPALPERPAAAVERERQALSITTGAALASAHDPEVRAAIAAIADDAARHWPARCRGLAGWALAELAAGRAQAWLRDSAPALPMIEATRHVLMLTASLFARLDELHRPLPHFRTMRWHELMQWVGETLHAFEVEEAAKWDEREVVYHFANGWTVERVRSQADWNREAVLVGNCLGEEELHDGMALYSLRDRQGRPHADLGVYPDGEAHIEGRFCLPAKPRYVEMLREFAAAVGIDEPENLPTGLAAPNELVASGVEETLLEGCLHRRKGERPTPAGGGACPSGSVPLSRPE